MKSITEITELVNYGIKAPSGHNTQPWLYAVNDNEINIYPDFSRALPVVDSDNHALYISLGCALENIVIAASKYGLRAEVHLMTSKGDNPYIKISLSSDDSIQKDELVEYIEDRQSIRNEYENRQVPAYDLESLKNAVHFHEIDILILKNSEDIERLEPLIIEGSNLQFQKRAFVDELVSWIRFSRKEAAGKGDGLWSKSMGFPAMNRFIGNIVMKYFVSAKSEAKRWKKLIQASDGFALFLARENDVVHWVRLGRAFQRFGLTATKLNISHAHVNMPCEELEVRKKLVEQFNLGSKHPLLLIRFGYSEKMPYSFRRNLDEVIRNTK